MPVCFVCSMCVCSVCVCSNECVGSVSVSVGVGDVDVSGTVMGHGDVGVAVGRGDVGAADVGAAGRGDVGGTISVCGDRSEHSGGLNGDRSAAAGGGDIGGLACGGEAALCLLFSLRFSLSLPLLFPSFPLSLSSFPFSLSSFLLSLSSFPLSFSLPLSSFSFSLSSSPRLSFFTSLLTSLRFSFMSLSLCAWPTTDREPREEDRFSCRLFIDWPAMSWDIRLRKDPYSKSIAIYDRVLI